MNSVSISKIDPSLSLKKICSQKENQFFERKSARIASKDLAHHISAFANAGGGVVVVGVEDNGDISGVSATSENALRKSAIEFISNPPKMEIENYSCKDANGNDCIILLFHISSSADEIVVLKTGEAYLRVGDSSIKLTHEQFLSLEYSRGIKSFETRIVEDATLEDLDDNLIQQYIEMLNASVSSAFDILRGRGLIKGTTDHPQITVAAVLLFGRIPTQFLPSARVRFLKYEGIAAGVGTGFNVVKDITIEKPLHLLLTEARQIISSQMREFQRLDKNGQFVKVSEYPDFAWLEGLVNAVTHRDYSISGDYIRISMFDDRIEFRSPGCLPSIVTIDNIKTTRFSRNPIIARVLSDFGWVRELNEGVKRIYVDMENYFLDPPIFSEPNGNTVSLLLKNNIAVRAMRKAEASIHSLSDKWQELSSLDREIVFYIANLGSCTPMVLERLTNKTRPTITKHIKKLNEQGILVEHSSSVNDPTKYYTVNYE